MNERTRVERGRASFVALTLALVSTAIPRITHAWNDSGHMQVALVAWQVLTKEERTKVVAVLKAHPRFKEDFVPPDSVVEGGPELVDKWIFAHAATWPDIARSFQGELRDRYHRGTWHYINEPLFLSEEDAAAMHGTAPASVNVDHKLPANPDEGRLNVVQAMKLCVARVNQAGVTMADKALYLSWLFHLVGDVHQPLHGASLFSRKTFPEGDKGGNALKVTNNTNLHSKWDATLGTGDSLAFTANRAHHYLLDKDLKAAGEEAADVELFTAWVEESYEGAYDEVYSSEILVALEENEQKTKPVKEPRVPTDAQYFERATKLAQKRAVEAGFRLAHMIRAK